MIESCGTCELMCLCAGIASKTTPITSSVSLPKERILHLANSSRGRTTLSVQVSALGLLCGVSLAYFFVDEWVWCKYLLYYSTIECPPQITRFDEQRENGTFPASLEP